jgi:hypothetical protein
MIATSGYGVSSDGIVESSYAPSRQRIFDTMQQHRHSNVECAILPNDMKSVGYTEQLQLGRMRVQPLPFKTSTR